MTFGEKVKMLREEQGLSQSELANKMNITQQAIAKYEKTIDTPKLATVRKIATALDVALSELVDNWSLFSPEEYKEEMSDFGNGFYGKEAPPEVQEKFKKRLFSRKAQMSHKMDLLSDAGQDMALGLVELVTKIPEYQKDPEK